MRVLIAIFGTIAQLALLAGCAINTQVVKVPMAVPCVSAPLVPSDIPVSTLTETEAQGLMDAGLYGDLADRTAASIILLQADRAALLAQQDVCSKIPVAASVIGTAR